MGVAQVIQISNLRGSEEPNGITRNSDEKFAKVTRWTFLAKECNFSLRI